MTAADKIAQMMRAQSAKQKKLKNKQEDQVYTPEIDEHIPVTQYIIVKDDKGKNVYKRRVVQ